MGKRLEFELYDQLTPEQRIHIGDLRIVHSIKNAGQKNFTEEEQDRLFVIIDYACSENQTEVDNIRISDKVVEAYANREVTLDTLEKASAIQILDAAIGMGTFKYLEEEIEEDKDL